MDHKATSYNGLQKALAWAVHLFTASGLLAGFMAILAVSAHEWRNAMFWLIVSQFIDGIDGTLARMAKVREVLPFFDGKNLDYVIDFATYAIIPAYFFFESGLTEGLSNWIGTFVILLSSAMYYGKDGMVADEQYFIGFPVLWNWVIFYLFFVMGLPAWGNLLLVIILAILHFVPIKFAYPSRARTQKVMTLTFTVITLVSVGFLLYFYPEPAIVWKWICMLGLVYFGGLAVWTTYIGR